MCLAWRVRAKKVLTPVSEGFLPIIVQERQGGRDGALTGSTTANLVARVVSNADRLTVSHLHAARTSFQGERKKVYILS